jgi:AcrR family transcriptional regulator
VTDTAQAPGILGRRQRRLSDGETEERMLTAAAAMINQTGLTVSLDHLSFEDVIRDARVSRSAVYRRWPYKDLFFSDLLKELARAAVPAATTSPDTTLVPIKRFLFDHFDELAADEPRRDLVLELMRQASVWDLETMHGSTEWRTYLALHATFLSVADETLRGELQAALAESERAFIERIAASWQFLAGVLGLRLRPEVDASFETIANLVSAVARGLVLMSLASPDIATRPIKARPFGASEAAEWSPAAIALTSIATTFLEADPAVVWDTKRLAGIRKALESRGPAVS